MSRFRLICRCCKEEIDPASYLATFCINYRADRSIGHILERISTIDHADSIFKDFNENVHPFLFFKELSIFYHISGCLGISFERVVEHIQNNLIDIEGKGIFVTELSQITEIDGVDTLFIKNETLNVGGSHKIRHLMGNLIYIEILKEAGIINYNPKLAIYSCGNAALSASILARAAGYSLDVFIPPDANKTVIDMIESNGANIRVCYRGDGEKGDPCYNCFTEAVSSGSIPFSCSGLDNWSNIEGGITLAYELFAQLCKLNKKIDGIVIQVGGGALASSVIKGIQDLHSLKYISNIPKIYTLQTASCYPLARAYLLVLSELAKLLNISMGFSYRLCRDINGPIAANLALYDYLSSNMKEVSEIALSIKSNFLDSFIDDYLNKISMRANEYMWAWESTPVSIAHGILDDITYDSIKVLEGMLKSGGIPIIVNEDHLYSANVEGRKVTSVDVDPTGSSGFAGLRLLIENRITDKSENFVLFFTGIDRSKKELPL